MNLESMKRLGDSDVAKIIMGQSPSSESYNFKGKGLPFFQGKADFGFIYPSVRQWCSTPIRVAKKNDILLSVRAPVGDVNICEEDCCIGRGLAAVRCNRLTFRWYLFFYLIENKKLLENHGTGTTFKSINKEAIFEFRVWLPHFSEQQKIAAVLFKIQKAIEIQESIIEKTRELKKSTLHHGFTNGLRGEKLKETEIGRRPENWVVTKVGTYCQKPEYGLTESAIIDEIGPKFLRITDITENGVNWDTVPYCRCPQDIFPKYALKDNDILFARIGATTGKSYIVRNPPRAVFASYLIRLRPLAEVIPDYLYYFFHSEVYWNQVNANKKNNLKGGINSSVLAEMLFPLPLKEEQQEIANILTTIDKTIEIQTAKKSTLQDLFRTMLNKLMTGEIRVKDLDIDVSEVET